MPSPVYAMLPCKTHKEGYMMVYADEDGRIETIDVRAKCRPGEPVDESMYSPAVWKSHSNAVFDMAWLDRERKLVRSPSLFVRLSHASIF